LLERGRLRSVNAFAEAQKAVQRKSLLSKADLSFAEFLGRQRLPAKTRSLATMMVQGFDAADPALASARDIVDEWGDALAASQMRPQGGYGPLLQFLAQGLDIRLRTPVREVRWKRGLVEAAGIRARKAIVTLPLGVLQSGTVSFHPETGKPLEQLASGAVIRVAMQFDEAFWDRRCPGVAFFHSPRAAFPTFWTPLPMRAPLLTAWAGGPKASRLTGSSRQQLLALAVQSVRAVLGRIPQPKASLVQDWAADPYARCGYSYVKVGGQRARAALRRPIEDTLHFAGEATSSDEGGTVGGALASGERAARECLN
jgi:monoamine oxidase